MTDEQGPGRPRLGQELTKGYSISLTPALAQYLRQIGDGNMSAGVRKLIQVYKSVEAEHNSRVMTGEWLTDQ